MIRSMYCTNAIMVYGCLNKVTFVVCNFRVQQMASCVMCRATVLLRHLATWTASDSRNRTSIKHKCTIDEWTEPPRQMPAISSFTGDWSVLTPRQWNVLYRIAQKNLVARITRRWHNENATALRRENARYIGLIITSSPIRSTVSANVSASAYIFVLNAEAAWL